MDERSESKIKGVHPDLDRVIRKSWDQTRQDPKLVKFIVTEGLRTKDRQAALVAAGASTTMNSRHITGHAVDVAAFIDYDGDGDSEVRWDWSLYKKIADHIKQVARNENVDIEWGGDWKSFKDGPHFQLRKKSYA